MRYASIREFDISNGAGCGAALFTLGCHFHCKNCFNLSAWDFEGGKKWTKDLEDRIIYLLGSVHRLSILGGEPLEPCNLADILRLIGRVRRERPDTKIWIYTGYKFEDLDVTQKLVVMSADYLVDGPFVDELKDFNLKFRGSSNQRVIDIKVTMKEDKIITKFEEES